MPTMEMSNGPTFINVGEYTSIFLFYAPRCYLQTNNIFKVGISKSKVCVEKLRLTHFLFCATLFGILLEFFFVLGYSLLRRREDIKDTCNWPTIIRSQIERFAQILFIEETAIQRNNNTERNNGKVKICFRGWMNLYTSTYQWMYQQSLNQV